MVNRFTSVSTALTLKVVGVILILSFLLDFLLLLFPFLPTDRTWQIGLATNLVDRGIVPLVGLGILFAGYWIESADSDRPPSLDLRFPSLVLASILGLMFLLIFPMHLNNVNLAKDQRVTKINQDAEQLEKQINQLSQLQAQLNSAQGKAQLTEILKDEQKYKQVLADPQFPTIVKQILNKAKADPKELDKAIGNIEQLRTQQIDQLRRSKEEAEKQTKDTAWKSGLRTGISSLLLSIGYIIIGWTGLRGMGALQNGQRKTPAPR